ncbi:hypothetical protein DJ568_05870 [Mucilaginibacter hurinus]|uniref:DUF4251 domain-containing protein n=1 Tax=Mucilaginibacter hurinus TaxID=2201324 RepID=A0A367GPN2_9SPHI|nr:hypothetical protein [Mucilaginibacter hurinus]RCH55419.1 hypothetical protein DJ568_05870 [Mucilaginibacter hurinus]
MKKSLNLLLGILFLAVTCSNVFASTNPPSKDYKKAATSQSITHRFFYSAIASGSGYNITAYLFAVNYSNNTYWLVNSPQNYSINITSGPFSGYTLSFPVGVSSHNYGIFSTHPGTSMNVTITPTTSIIGVASDVTTLSGYTYIP